MISGQRQQPLGCSQVTCNEIKTDSFSNSPFLSLRWGGESMGGKVEGAFLFPPPNVNSPGCTAIALPVKEVSYQTPSQEAPVQRGLDKKNQLRLHF